MIIGSNSVNLLSYFYHLIIGRLLVPSSYGELSVLFSLIGILGTIPFALGIVVVRFISAAKTADESSSLIVWFNKKILLFSLILSSLVALASPLIASFLNMNNWGYILLVSLALFFTIPSFYNRSFLQGLLKFKQTVLSLMAETSLKLILGVSLVYLGFSVGGALVALVLAAFTGWIVSGSFLKKEFLFKSNIAPSKRSLLLYALPVLILTISTTSLLSADLILVKHFFSPLDAGLYAAISTLGKMIFFGVSPINSVMFPLVAKRNSLGEKSSRVFIYTGVLTVIFSLIGLIIYYLIPTLMVSLLYGVAYLSASEYLFLFGIFIALFSLSSVIINYYLSLGKIIIVIFPLFAAIGQVIGIILFHQSLFMIINVSITCLGFLFGSLLLFSLKQLLEEDVNKR